MYVYIYIYIRAEVKQDEHNMNVIMKIMFHPGYDGNGSVTIHAFGHA